MEQKFHNSSVPINDIHSCGSSQEPDFGTGDISISTRNHINGHAIDIGRIYFAEPTAEQRLNADTTSMFSKEGATASNVNRRLSRIQAEYVTMLINKALNEEFNGVIPSDAAIKEILGKK